MPQKEPNYFRGNVTHGNLIDLFMCLSRYKRKKESERIPVATLRISRQVALAY
jgi:hypothetical protein